MNKIYSLETKGEIVALLKSDLNYMDFVKVCKEAEEVGGSKDLYTIKAVLVQNYGFEEVNFSGGYEVTKRKGAL